MDYGAEYLDPDEEFEMMYADEMELMDEIMYGDGKRIKRSIVSHSIMFVIYNLSYVHLSYFRKRNWASEVFELR